MMSGARKRDACYYDDDVVHVVNKKKNEKLGHELPNYTHSCTNNSLVKTIGSPHRQETE